MLYNILLDKTIGVVASASECQFFPDQTIIPQSFLHFGLTPVVVGWYGPLNLNRMVDFNSFDYNRCYS